MKPKNLVDLFVNLKDEKLKGLRFIESTSSDNFIPYNAFLSQSLRRLKYFQDRGMKVGDLMIIQVENLTIFLEEFWACILGGIIPVPLQLSGKQDHLNKVSTIWNSLGNPYISTDAHNFNKLTVMSSSTEEILNERFVDCNFDISEYDQVGEINFPSVDDVAFIQYSSGSTGDPKGVVLSHTNLINNILDITNQLHSNANDVTLSWIPLTHDLGMIGFHLSSLLMKCNQILIPVALFIRRPQLWITKASEHRATHLYSPNFGYEYFLGSRTDLKDIDLSTVKVITNGAEPISYDLCQKFMDFLSPYGLKRETINPCYGLAEASVGVTAYNIDLEIQEVKLNRNLLNIGQCVEFLADIDDKNAVSFVDVGIPLPQCQVRVVDDQDNIINPNVIGRIQISGPNVTRGYYNNVEASMKLFSTDGWLRTGDLGFITDSGSLVITGREKNLIILNGQNFYPHDIEKQLQNISGISTGTIVACSYKDDDSWGEKLLIFILFKKEINLFIDLADEVRVVLSDQFGITAASIVPVRNIPKTTSGKIQNFILVESFLRGEYDLVVKELNLINNKFKLGEDHETYILTLVSKLVNVPYKYLLRERNFFELGGNSLMAMEFVSSLEKERNITIKLADIFEYETLGELIDYVISKSKVKDLKNDYIKKYPTKNKTYPLSYQQSSIFLSENLHFGSNRFNLNLCFEFSGSLNVIAFESAYRDLRSRYQILRMNFKIIDDLVVQFEPEVTKQNFFYFNVGEQIDSQFSIEEVIESYANKNFNLETDPLFRVFLFSLKQDKHILLLNAHHLVCDGWSANLLLNEFFNLYNNFSKNNVPSGKVAATQYMEFVNWQHSEFTTSITYFENVEFWKQYTLKSVPDFHIDAIKPLLEGDKKKYGKSKVIFHKFSDELNNFVISQSKRNKCSKFVILVSLFNAILHKYTGSKSVVVGTSVATRSNSRFHEMIGLMVNSVPIKVPIDPDDSFNDLITKVKTNINLILSHHDCFLEPIISIDTKNKDRNNEFSIFLEYNSYSLDFLEFSNVLMEDISITPIQLQNQDAQFDINLEFVDTNGGLKLKLVYNDVLYSRDFIDSILSAFYVCVQNIESEPSISLSNLSVLTDEDISEQLFVLSGEGVDLGNDRAINVRFSDIARDKPAFPAVIHGDICWSYAELDIYSSRVANLLLERGLSAGDFVGVHLGRCCEMLGCLLGILKAGGVYVPLDTQNPPVRTTELITSSASRWVISNGGLLSSLSLEDLFCGPLQGIICTDNFGGDVSVFGNTFLDYSDIISSSPDCPENVNSLDSWAYMLYTSGSTGVPKGAITRHGGAMNHMLAEFSALGLVSGFRFLQSAGLASDISVWQLLSPLMLGGCVVIIDREDLLEYVNVVGCIERTGITIVEFVPSYLSGLIDYLEELGPARPGLGDLRWLMLSGEEVSVDLVNRWFEMYPGIRMLNGYGPCEASDDITQLVLSGPLDPGTKKVSIGRPIANMNIFILDGSGKLVPRGVSGEICVSGIGVGAGYWQDPVRTSEKFIKNPFAGTLGDEIYRTGDMGRWQPDGNLEFLGRIDRQVKIRGFRVELGEIEGLLNAYPGVHRSHVMSCRGETRSHLVAFLVLSPGGVSDNILPSLRSHMRSHLPSHMRPDSYIEVEYFPLNLSDKVDEKQLQALYSDGESSRADEGDIIAPLGAVEEVLAEIWSEILSIPMEMISRDSSFFDLGGHSLLAIRVVSQIRKRLEVEVSIKDIFSHSVLMDLGKLILSTGSARGLQPVIVGVDRSGRLPLSFAQERLWFIDRLSGSTQYHMPCVYRISGSLDVQLLEASLSGLVERHEVLRSLLLEEDGLPYQVIVPSSDWHLDHISGEGCIDSYREAIASYISRPFDLSTDYKLRSLLVSLGADEYILVIVMHHIASDGWSESILVNDLVALYNTGEIQGTLPVQYGDYAVWQRSYLQGAVLSTQLSYWEDKLREISPLMLPTDLARPSVQGISGSQLVLNIGPEIHEGLIRLGQEYGATLYMTLLSVVKILLYRYSGQEDISIGSPVAGRGQDSIEGVVGFFVNSVVMRSDLSGNPEFRDLLVQIRDTVLDAYTHQDVPFEKVVEAVSADRDLSRHPLFQVMFALQNTPEVRDLALGGAMFETAEVSSVTTQFDLMFDIEENSKGLEVTFTYSTDLYTRSTAEQLLGHFVRLLTSVVNTPDCRICALDMLSDEDISEQLFVLSGEDVGTATAESFLDKFSGQALKNRAHIALRIGDETMSYGELWDLSERLGHYLVHVAGVCRGDLVGVCMDRSADMVVSLLGILKSGAGYVPVEPGHPVDRTLFILESSSCRLVLADDIGQSSLVAAGYSGNILHIQDPAVCRGDKNIRIEGDPIDVNSVAYVIYTSGSTGEPKGVMVTRSNLDFFLDWCDREFSDSEFDVVYAGTTICFDLSIFEIFYPLSIGRSIRLLRDALSIHEYVEREDSILLNTVPSVVRELQSSGRSLSGVRVLNMAGEPVQLDLIHGLDRERMEVRNLYGPTEDTTYSTVWLADTGMLERVYIGRPISNTQIYILGAHGELLPKGSLGEICLSGKGLSQGYIGREDLTRERFIDHPYLEGIRMYRTGDLGCWGDNGYVEYHGRRDEQVKVQGFRIELGEIEHAITKSGQVISCAVQCRDNGHGLKELVAYVVCGPDYRGGELERYLRDVLPPYMVPVHYMELEALPLTASGKIDRRSLPAPADNVRVTIARSRPINDVEEALAEIWSEILSIPMEMIYRDSSFFDLGGHSLLAIRVVSRIQNIFNIQVNVYELFRNPTIIGFSERIINQGSNYNELIKPFSSSNGLYEATPSQRNIWFAHHASEQKNNYNIILELRSKERLDVEAFKISFVSIIKKYEILRTSFIESNGTILQKIHQFDYRQIQVLEYGHLKDDDNKIKEIRNRETQFEFELATNSLMRLNIINGIDHHHIIINIHHIIMDGWSLQILQKELEDSYRQIVLGKELRQKKLAIQFKDYSEWANNRFKNDNKLQQYWISKLKGIKQRGKLAVDMPTHIYENGIEYCRRFSLGKNLSEKIVIIAKELNTSIFIVMQSLIKLLLRDYYSLNDLVVGSPVAGRDHPQLETQIGLFINMLVLRDYFDSNYTFYDWIDKVKQTTIEGFEHQIYPIEYINEILNDPKTDLGSQIPLFDVLFTYMDEIENTDLDHNQIFFESQENEVETESKYPIVFRLEKNNKNEIILEIGCNSSLFFEESVIEMQNRLIHLSNEVMDSPDTPLSELLDQKDVNILQIEDDFE